MKSTFDGFNHIIRLDRGESLMTSLQRFAREAKSDGAWLSGLGAAEQLTLGFYNLETKRYEWRTFDGLYEIVSLQGNIALSKDGQPIIHLHGAFAGADHTTIGGHVRDFVVGGTCELLAHRTYQPLARRHDDTTGLELLDL